MAEKTKKSKATEVKGGPVRFSYAHVFKAKSMDPDDPDSQKKYSVALIIKKTDKLLLNQIRAAIKAAVEAGKTSKWGGKIPAGWKNPLRDGDEERSDDPNYANCYFVNATSTTKPPVIDINRDPITEESGDFYSGCFGRFIINFYPFNKKGNRGVAAGLNALQKTKDGERLAGGTGAEGFDDDYEEQDDDYGSDDDDMI